MVKKSFDKIRMGYQTSFKSVNFYHKNMQCHTETLIFGLILNLNISPERLI